jgi:hypothetical protein
MVRQWQDIFYENRLSASDLHDNPNFVAVAEAFGVKGFHINSSKDLKANLQTVLDYNDGPCLIHVEVEKEEGVFPMVPSGQFADKMILEAPQQNKMSTRTAPPTRPVAQQNGTGQNNVAIAAKTHHLQLQVLPEENLFLRIGFVLSKKMFSLQSYKLHGNQLDIQVQGPEQDLPKLIKLFKRTIKVLQVHEAKAVTLDSIQHNSTEQILQLQNQ